MKPGKSNWFTVANKPRQKQIALENLQRQGLECILPMTEKPYQRHSKKHQRIIEPLFPLYLFLKANASYQNLAPVCSTTGVLGMVRFGIELDVVPEGVINTIKASIEKDTGLVKIKLVAIKSDDKVRIFDDPLAGISGTVEETNSKNRALILMELPGRPTKVEVEAIKYSAPVKNTPSFGA